MADEGNDRRDGAGNAALTAVAPHVRRRSHPSSRMFSVVLMAVFFVVMMIALVAGVSLYRSAAGAQERSKDLNLQAGLLANTVHTHDRSGCVESGEGPEGEALVLVEETGGAAYETRLYLYRGNVVQEYALAGRAYDPGNATALLESETFSFDYDGGLLSITTDRGTSEVYIRSENEGGLR